MSEPLLINWNKRSRTWDVCTCIGKFVHLEEAKSVKKESIKEETIMKLEINKIENADEWKFQLYVNESAFGIYSSEEAALRAGCKKLLSMKTFDFGKGQVAAHQHKNGGGWVADTAHVDETAFVGPNARVYGHARVCGHVRVREHAQVYGHAQLFDNVIVQDNVKIYGTAIITGYIVISDDIVFNSIKISKEEITRNV